MAHYRGRVVFFLVIALFCPLIAQHHAPAPAAAAGGPPQQLDPGGAIQMLVKGNERFVRGSRISPNQSQSRRTETARGGQFPFVTILSCSDSRVPLELIFDAGIGDLFVIRVAGNIADQTEIGSLEYGIGHLGTPLLLVLGHSKCGAVTAAVAGAKVNSNIASLIDNIAPAVEKTRKLSRKITQDELIEKSIKANVWQSIEDIFKNSDEICQLVAEGRIKVIGGIYDLENGKFTNLGVHLQQEKLVRKIETEPDL